MLRSAHITSIVTRRSRAAVWNSPPSAPAARAPAAYFGDSARKTRRRRRLHRGGPMMSMVANAPVPDPGTALNTACRIHSSSTGRARDDM
jgi:hypothetical protein